MVVFAVIRTKQQMVSVVAICLSTGTQPTRADQTLEGGNGNEP